MTDQTNNHPPPDWALDWGKIRYDPMAERAAFAVATGGPASMIPRAPGHQPSPPPRVATGNRETPIAPPPGINLVDAICVAADQRERREAAAPDMMQQMLQALTLLVLREDDQTKRKPKSPAAEDNA